MSLSRVAANRPAFNSGQGLHPGGVGPTRDKLIVPDAPALVPPLKE